MAEIAKYSKDQSSEIKIFGDVVLAFFNGFIYICDCFIELVFIEVKDGSVEVESGDMVVGKLWEMTNSDRDALNDLINNLVFVGRVRKLFKFVLYFVKCQK